MTYLSSRVKDGGSLSKRTAPSSACLGLNASLSRGVDTRTEGRVSEFAQRLTEGYQSYVEWNTGKNNASRDKVGLQFAF